MIFEIVNTALAMVALGVIGYGLFHTAKAIIAAYEHHKWAERCDKYNRWLKDYEERKDRMPKKEFEEVMDHLHIIVTGGNKDMRGPWELLP